jgi:hypothetical protein
VLNGDFSEPWLAQTNQGIVFFEFRFRFMDISSSVQRSYFSAIAFVT